MPQATIDFLRLSSTLLSKVASLDTLFHIPLLIYFDNTAHPAILLLICKVLIITHGTEQVPYMVLLN